LDRIIEFLPDDETMRHRLSQRIGLTRPELAVLLAYSKMALYDELLPSDLPDDPQLTDDLINYFPTALREAYRSQILSHRLRREIIATVVTNSLVNRMGSTFVHVTKEKTGQSASAITRAYAITRGAFKLRDMWAAIEALDNQVAAETQTAMRIEINRLAEQATLWFLRNGQHPLDIAGNIAEMQPGIAAIETSFAIVVSSVDRQAIGERYERLVAQGVPEPLAHRLAQLPILSSALDVVRIAAQSKIKVEDAAQTYYAIGDQFHLDWLRAGAKGLIGDSHWERLAVFAIVDDLYGHQRELTTAVLANGGKSTGQPAIDKWREARGATLVRADQLFGDLRQVGKLELAMLAVANRTLRSLLG
jgi:glutamate dehydrogenase